MKTDRLIDCLKGPLRGINQVSLKLSSTKFEYCDNYWAVFVSKLFYNDNKSSALLVTSNFCSPSYVFGTVAFWKAGIQLRLSQYVEPFRDWFSSCLCLFSVNWWECTQIYLQPLCVFWKYCRFFFYSVWNVHIKALITVLRRPIQCKIEHTHKHSFACAFNIKWKSVSLVARSLLQSLSNLY